MSGMSWYGEYKGRCYGRLLHVVNLYDSLSAAEQIAVSDGIITYRGKPYATYEWEGESDTPNLNFIDEGGKQEKLYRDRNQKIYKPYLDDDAKRFGLTYAIQEIRKDMEDSGLPLTNKELASKLEAVWARGYFEITQADIDHVVRQATEDINNDGD